MESDKIELAERLMSSGRWRWMPGMRTINGRRLAVVFGASRTAAVLCDLRDDANSDTEDLQGELPDLNDPATVGCLLALVREAWGMPTGITVTYSSDEGLWGVSWSGATHGGCCGRGETEGEALVAALESAP
jgi:hypothetical protein